VSLEAAQARSAAWARSPDNGEHDVTIRNTFILICLPLALTACKRGEDYVVLPLSHPASPEARPGVQVADTTTLTPELRMVRPDLDPAREAVPPASAGGHNHHQH
jgi:hypothetical protein